MNQLKAQETLIRKVHREAQEFEASSERARHLLQEIDSVLTTSKEHDNTINATLEQIAATLTKATEAEQKIAGLAVQAEQHDSAAARHEASAKEASATAQAIAEQIPTVQTEIEAAKRTFDDLAGQTKSALSNFEQSSDTSIETFQRQYDDVKTTTEAEINKLRDAITQQSEGLQRSTEKLLTDTSDQLKSFQLDHTSKLDAQREAINTQARETINAVNTEFRANLAEQNARCEAQRTSAQGDHDRLVAELDKLEGQIKDSIRRATGFTLFHSFQKRQDDLVSSKNFWARALAGVVILAVALSIAFIVYVNFVQNFGPAFYLKLSVSLPLIYAIWFCSVQYSRERRLEEEYAFKSSISISLDPYRELVEKLVAKENPEELAKYTAFIIIHHPIGGTGVHVADGNCVRPDQRLDSGRRSHQGHGGPSKGHYQTGKEVEVKTTRTTFPRSQGRLSHETPPGAGNESTSGHV